jgi:hypothetical protein
MRKHHERRGGQIIERLRRCDGTETTGGLLTTAVFRAFARRIFSLLAASAFAISDVWFDAGAISGTTGGGN